jgi:hypothetical protein
MKRATTAFVAKTFVIVAVTWFVVVVIGAFAESATAIVRPPFSLKLTPGPVRFLISPEMFASEALFAGIIVSLIIQVVSVSGHCFPPLIVNSES